MTPSQDYGVSTDLVSEIMGGIQDTHILNPAMELVDQRRHRKCQQSGRYWFEKHGCLKLVSEQHHAWRTEKTRARKLTRAPPSYCAVIHQPSIVPFSCIFLISMTSAGKA